MHFIIVQASCFFFCVSIITLPFLFKIVPLDVEISPVPFLTFHCLLLLSVVSGQNSNITRMASNNGNEDAPRADEGNVPPAEPEQSIWRSTWQNNKGALLILSSVICGASMDAIARFLQQGGAGFHTLEVCRFIVPRRSENSR